MGSLGDRIRPGARRDLTGAQWQHVLEAHGRRCYYCGRRDLPLTQDHLAALARGGDHTVGNVVPACGSCNSRKGDRTEDDYAELRERVPDFRSHPWRKRECRECHARRRKFGRCTVCGREQCYVCVDQYAVSAAMRLCRRCYVAAGEPARNGGAGIGRSLYTYSSRAAEYVLAHAAALGYPALPTDPGLAVAGGGDAWRRFIEHASSYDLADADRGLRDIGVAIPREWR